MFFLLASCSSAEQVAEHEWIPVPSADLGPALARVGQVPIFAKQVTAEAKKTGKSARMALDDLIDANLLAEAARAKGYTPASSGDPDVQSALVQRMVEKELEPHIRPEDTPDSALRPLYDRVRDQFVHPRLVEIGLLAVYTGPTMRKTAREEREQTGKDLALYLRKHPAKTLEEFAAVARDTAWSARKVVYTRMLQGLDKPLAADVGTEIAKLHTPGDTTPLITDQDGSFIARYIGERAPANVTFEQARAKLLAGYYDHWRHQKFIEFTTRLMKHHQVKAHFDRLSTNEQGL